MVDVATVGTKRSSGCGYYKYKTHTSVHQEILIFIATIQSSRLGVRTTTQAGNRAAIVINPLTAGFILKILNS